MKKKKAIILPPAPEPVEHPGFYCPMPGCRKEYFDDGFCEHGQAKVSLKKNPNLRGSYFVEYSPRVIRNKRD